MEVSFENTLRGLLGVLAAPTPNPVSVSFQIECDTVHAPPLPAGLLRPVVKDVAEVRVAACAAHLGARHPVRAVLDELDGIRRDRLGEARPAGARVVLSPAIKERVAAGGAVVEALFVGVHVLTGERTLGRRLAQDGVLLWREPLAPLLVGVGQLGGRRILAKPDRTAHAGPAEAAVSVWDLVEVLLVVALSVVERAGGRDLRGNRIIAGTPQGLLVGVAALLGGPALLVVGVVDRRAVLRAFVVALAHPLRRVVGLPEHREQVPVGDLLGVEGDEHSLGVPGTAAANLLVGRVRREAPRVADRRRVDAVDLPEPTLCTPEAAEAEDRGAHTLEKGRLKGRAEHGVPLGNGERRLLPSGERLCGRDHGELMAIEKHLLPPHRWVLWPKARASVGNSFVHLHCLLTLDRTRRLSDHVPSV